MYYCCFHTWTKFEVYILGPKLYGRLSTLLVPRRNILNRGHDGTRVDDGIWGTAVFDKKVLFRITAIKFKVLHSTKDNNKTQRNEAQQKLR